MDTELTGLDLAFGARPFLVTICREDGTNLFWEWRVNPMTREVAVPPEDAEEIRREVAAADEVVGQNLKIDAKALQAAGIIEEWPWHKSQDTLVAGHLLASGMPHDLTSMVLHYCRHSIKSHEEELKEAVLDCRRRVASMNRVAVGDGSDLFGGDDPQRWRVAKEGDPMMPSAGSEAWHFDYWLPKAWAEHENLPNGECEVVNMRCSEFDVDIGRPGPWGNPFRMDGVMSREEVVEQYARWVVEQPDLMRQLPTLIGKRLGCWCKPELCHGDVLRRLVKERCAHSYWTVCSRYANSDSAWTLLLWNKMRGKLMADGLWKVYRESMQLPGILAEMERRGTSYNVSAGEAQRAEYVRESAEFAERCQGIAKSVGYDLELPKGAVNNSLRWFAFGYDQCACGACGLEFKDNPGKMHTCKSKKCKSDKISVSRVKALDLPPISFAETGPSLNKESFDVWETTLDGHQLDFVLALSAKRKRDTAATYLAAYSRFAHPSRCPGYGILHPNINQTGTAHLRHSSDNPNGQNAGKQRRPCNYCRGTGEQKSADGQGLECGVCRGEGEVDFNVRRPFQPLPGREFWAMDYENIELKIPSYYCGEKLMIELFERHDEPPYWGSQHLLNASIIYPELFWPLKDIPPSDSRSFKKRYASEEYQWIKNFDFALAYQCGEAQGDRTARRTGAWRKIKDTFRELDKLAQRNYAFAKKHGYVELIPDKSVDPHRGYTIMTGRGSGGFGDLSPTIPHNYWTSGNACWAKRRAMVRCAEQLDEWNAEVLRDAGLTGTSWRVRTDHLDRFGYHMSLEIHDEILFDFPAGGRCNWGRAMRLKQLMERSGDDISIPLTVAVSWHPKTWAESEEPFPKEAAA